MTCIKHWTYSCFIAFAVIWAEDEQAASSWGHGEVLSFIYATTVHSFYLKNLGPFKFMLLHSSNVNILLCIIINHTNDLLDIEFNIA